MGLPKDLVEYDVKVTFPSERDYWTQVPQHCLKLR